MKTPVNYNKLLLTFFLEGEQEKCQEKIKNTYNILNNKVFLFNILETDKYFLTYRALLPVNTILDSTILIHRRNETNTLYTLNALNKLITEENNGVYSKDYQLNWYNYSNTLVLVKDTDIIIHSLKFIKHFQV